LGPGEALETLLQRIRPLEALGLLAGGIAHDFNNILATILGYTQLLQEGAAPGSAQAEALGEILRAGLRARDLVQNISHCNWLQEPELAPIVLPFALKQGLKLVRAALPAGITLESRLEGQARVVADPAQIIQLLIGLCAAVGCGLQRGGRLRVASGGQAAEPQPGGMPRVSLEVTGRGPDGTAPASPSPVGAARVEGIADALGGRITALRRPDGGVGLMVELPAAAPDNPGVDERATPRAPAGDAHILVVDDEAPVLRITRRLLETAGFRVTTCEDSRAALELFRGEPEAFDLIISDVTMPHLGGEDLTRALLAIRPAAAVILSSGVGRRIDPGRSSALGAAAFLAKPVMKAELFETVRLVLAARRAQPSPASP
jgi:CheY-like chemotaxis protein